MNLTNNIITDERKKKGDNERISEVIESANNELKYKYQIEKPNLSYMKNIKILKSSHNGKVKVFVCGGSNTVSEEFYDDAYNVGKTLAELNTAYGQGGITKRDTVMGETYWGYKENGGSSTNLFVKEAFMEDIQQEYSSVEGVYAVDSIIDLIKAQYLWSDVVVIMPGGTGTLMEILGYMEQNLDYKTMPKIILYNKKVGEIGFFDAIKSQIEFMNKSHFISRDVLESFDEVDNIEDLKNLIILEVKNMK